MLSRLRRAGILLGWFAVMLVMALLVPGCQPTEQPKLAPQTEQDKAILEKMHNRPRKSERGAGAAR